MSVGVMKDYKLKLGLEGFTKKKMETDTANFVPQRFYTGHFTKFPATLGSTPLRFRPFRHTQTLTFFTFFPAMYGI
jgi:hypothetical protein